MLVTALSFALVGAMFVLPLWALLSAKRFSRDESKSGAAVGNALQELDRLVARPAIEHKVEVEDGVVSQNEIGGE